MSRDDVSGRDERPDPNDEIEIIEVVGLDEHAPPSGVDPDEIDVLFDEDDRDVYETAADPCGDDGSGRGGPHAEAARERIARLQADFENLKKRHEREKDEFYVHATSKLIERLLPVLDNFERAVTHAEEDPGALGDGFLEGVRLIHKQLLDEFVRHGLREVEAVGRPFDPRVHEAVATEFDETAQPDHVTMEFQRGYQFRDRLLRPALVKVNISPDERDTASVADDDDGAARAE